ncbi:MAG: hypothetical protein HC888_00700 [Candidatus Competibacteraceae bacterium]|nr:hypothetical protein [Candidatus Competibacteraceae bacterium]
MEAYNEETAIGFMNKLLGLQLRFANNNYSLEYFQELTTTMKVWSDFLQECGFTDYARFVREFADADHLVAGKAKNLAYSVSRSKLVYFKNLFWREDSDFVQSMDSWNAFQFKTVGSDIWRIYANSFGLEVGVDLVSRLPMSVEVMSDPVFGFHLLSDLTIEEVRSSDVLRRMMHFFPLFTLNMKMPFYTSELYGNPVRRDDRRVFASRSPGERTFRFFIPYVTSSEVHSEGWFGRWVETGPIPENFIINYFQMSTTRIPVSRDSIFEVANCPPEEFERMANCYYLHDLQVRSGLNPIQQFSVHRWNKHQIVDI